MRGQPLCYSLKVSGLVNGVMSTCRAGLGSDTYLRERPRTKIKPCHCAGVQIDPVIVRVYQSIKPWHWAGIQIDSAIVRVCESSLAIVQIYSH